MSWTLVRNEADAAVIQSTRMRNLNQVHDDIEREWRNRPLWSVAGSAEINDLSPVPEYIRKQVSCLERIAGFNTPGARAVHKRACDSAVMFLELVRTRYPLTPLPKSITHSVHGAVSLCWDFDGRKLLLQVFSRNRIYFQSATTDRRVERGYITRAVAVRKLRQMFKPV